MFKFETIDGPASIICYYRKPMSRNGVQLNQLTIFFIYFKKIQWTQKTKNKLYWSKYLAQD